MEGALSDGVRRLVSPHLLRGDTRAEVLDRADGAPMLQQQRRAPGDEVLDVLLQRVSYGQSARAFDQRATRQTYWL